MCKKDGQGLSFIFTYPSGEKIKIVYGKNYTEIKKIRKLIANRFKKIYISHTPRGWGSILPHNSHHLLGGEKNYSL
jgi:hypothetical protein